MDIFHEWQYYDEIEGKWVDDMTIKLSVTGGRDQGFRTYSLRNNLKNGKWRVNVITSQNQLIGRLRFIVEEVNEKPTLLTMIKT